MACVANPAAGDGRRSGRAPAVLVAGIVAPVADGPSEVRPASRSRPDRDACARGPRC